jgi:hypothetical protein
LKIVDLRRECEHGTDHEQGEVAGLVLCSPTRTIRTLHLDGQSVLKKFVNMAKDNASESEYNAPIQVNGTRVQIGGRQRILTIRVNAFKAHRS